ncbi:hypothetical protein GQ457_07G040700 [Hibiscus cannabinus]
MSELRLEQVTENLIFKWRDAIKDALRMNLKVDFAMEHLRKVARAFIGLMERRKLDDMASGIPSLEGQFSAGKRSIVRYLKCPRYIWMLLKSSLARLSSGVCFESLPTRGVAYARNRSPI